MASREEAIALVSSIPIKWNWDHGVPATPSEFLLDWDDAEIVVAVLYAHGYLSFKNDEAE